MHLFNVLLLMLYYYYLFFPRLFIYFLDKTDSCLFVFKKTEQNKKTNTKKMPTNAKSCGATNIKMYYRDHRHEPCRPS